MASIKQRTLKNDLTRIYLAASAGSDVKGELHRKLTEQWSYMTSYLVILCFSENKSTNKSKKKHIL